MASIERSDQALREFDYAAGHDLQEPLRKVTIASILSNRNDRRKLDGHAERILATNVEGVITCDHLPIVRMDEIHLLQLFQNLLSNSLRYRHPGRPTLIQISAEQRGTDWVFAVQDNGIGFNPAYRERIFGIFKRLHARHEYAGNGIGLATCSRIVQYYGGRIWASSVLGRGATFFFQLSANGNFG